MAKVMISMPDELLVRVDEAADARGTTRSGFLREAAQRQLGWPDPNEIDAALAAGRAALAGLAPDEASTAIRDERDHRDARDRRRR